MRVFVGTTWTDSRGRTWEVFERLPFGMFKVRTTDLSRVGEMSGRAIIAHLQFLRTLGQDRLVAAECRGSPRRLEAWARMGGMPSASPLH